VSTNTAVGASALAANTSGAFNNAFGTSALASNTTASANNAFGWLALTGNTTGASNSSFGHAALTTNSTGSYNSAFGQGALQLSTTSSNNTAVGYQAGYTNTTGTINAYFGAYAGYVATGSYNTFIGTSCGEAVTTGSKNTIIGRFNGNQNGLDMRTINNVVVLSDGDGTLIMNAQKDASIALQGAITKAGIGITFPATQSASTDANTLDDYEEGNWTPAFVSDGGTTGTQTNTSVWGRYIKIGRQVTVWFKWNGTLSGYTGTLQISGLPFSVGTSTDAYQYGGNFYSVSSTATASNGVNFLFFAYSGSLYPVYTTGQSGAYLFTGSSQINGLTEFYGSHTYYALA
jgi:hypothetical protein